VSNDAIEDFLTEAGLEYAMPRSVTGDDDVGTELEEYRKQVRNRVRVRVRITYFDQPKPIFNLDFNPSPNRDPNPNTKVYGELIEEAIDLVIEKYG
jgi:Tfp pilus assembly protein PilP